MEKKKTYFRVSPELSDGVNWSIVEDTDVLLESIREWCDEFTAYPGEGFAVEVVEMTDEELEALSEL